MKRSLNILLAGLLIIFGLIMLPLPIPFGLISITIGLAILTKNSESSRRYCLARLHEFSRKKPKHFERLTRLSPYLPAFITELIKTSQLQPDTNVQSNEKKSNEEKSEEKKG